MVKWRLYFLLLLLSFFFFFLFSSRFRYFRSQGAVDPHQTINQETITFSFWLV